MIPDFLTMATKKILRFVTGFIFIFYCTNYFAKAQPVSNESYLFSTGDSSSSALKKSTSNTNSSFLKPLPRLFYTGYVMFSSSIAGHLYLYLRTTDQDWGNKISWKHIEQSFTMWPQFEEDHWTFNYLVHPYMGSLTYLASRNRGGRILPSLGLSALNATLYEYFIASSIQRPSINDMIVTPLGGMLLGEGLFAFKHFMLRDRYLTIPEKILLLAIDPYECLRYNFKFSKFLIQNNH